MQAEQLMSRPVHTCRIHDDLGTTAQIMWERDVGAVPVLADDDTVVGMITDRDVCMAAYTQGRPLSEIPVASAMAKRVFSCGPTASVEALEQLMRDQRIHRVPVLDAHGHAIGIVSLGDVARAAAASRATNGSQRQVVETLATICEPRREPTRAKGEKPPRATA